MSIILVESLLLILSGEGARPYARRSAATLLALTFMSAFVRGFIALRLVTTNSLPNTFNGKLPNYKLLNYKFLQELPIQIPTANTNTPPTTT
jgi:hypothetical protein